MSQETDTLGFFACDNLLKHNAFQYLGGGNMRHSENESGMGPGQSVRTQAGTTAAAIAIILVVTLVLVGGVVFCSMSITSKPNVNTNTTAHTYSTSATSHSNSATTSNASNASNSTTQATTAEDVADKLPYKGMRASLIDSTWLGEHEGTDTLVVTEKTRYFEVGTYQVYYWYSKNGKNDVVFTAYAKDGKVGRVVKGLSGTDYWPSYGGLPDLYATGTKRQSTTSSSNAGARPDPSDYEDVEEFVADLKDWQRKTGDTSSSYDDPYDEWELSR